MGCAVRGSEANRANVSILTREQRAAWERDGFVLVKRMFDVEEASLLRRAIEEDPTVSSHFSNRYDEKGNAAHVVLWNHPGDSVYGLAARCNRVVDTMEDLLGDEVYHYHSKLTGKPPMDGGAWEWHQDYGYWYSNGCLFPNMASVMVALDPCTRANGCLQVVRGSHLMGRIDHGLLSGQQVGADPERLVAILPRSEIVYAEMEPGDGLFFHCNTLHRSDQNTSPHRRWTVIMSYNARRNDPYRAHHHPSYTPLQKVSDSAIKKAGLKFSSAEDQKHFAAGYIPPADLKRKIAP